MTFLFQASGPPHVLPHNQSHCIEVVLDPLGKLRHSKRSQGIHRDPHDPFGYDRFPTSPGTICFHPKPGQLQSPCVGENPFLCWVSKKRNLLVCLPIISCLVYLSIQTVIPRYTVYTPASWRNPETHRDSSHQSQTQKKTLGR